MFCLVRPFPGPGAAPGLFEVRPYPVPLVVQLPAETLLDDVVVLGKTQPGFLAEGKVGGGDVLQRPGPAVLAVLLSRHADPVDDVVDRPLVAGIVRHLVVDTMVDLDSRASVENVVEVRDDSLEGHGSVEDPGDSSPSTAVRKVSFPDDLHEFVVDSHVRSQDQKAALDRFDFFVRSAHVEIAGEKGVDLLGDLLGRELAGDRRGIEGPCLVSRQHPIEEAVQWFQHERVEIHVDDGRVLGQRVGLELDEFLLPAASVLLDLGPQVVSLDVLDGHRGLPLEERVAEGLEGLRALDGGGVVDRVHLVVVFPAQFSVDGGQMDAVLEDGGPLGDGIGPAARDAYGKTDRGGFAAIVVVVVIIIVACCVVGLHCHRGQLVLLLVGAQPLDGYFVVVVAVVRGGLQWLLLVGGSPEVCAGTRRLLGFRNFARDWWMAPDRRSKGHHINDNHQGGTTQDYVPDRYPRAGSVFPSNLHCCCFSFLLVSVLSGFLFPENWVR
mmetsp:Transcript_3699/g.8451  ORF Transcript_3699/g.8451 Transcript_3699/m.8451 type:complete len:495 (-) Transcript_3699:93-1577(-)